MTPTPTPPAPDPDRDLVVSRRISAPAALLFRTFSEPEHLLRWFGPEPYPLARAEVDFRVGGRFTFAMRDPSGALMPPFGGEYLEIEPDRRIVYSNGFHHEGTAMVVTVTFDEDDGATTVTIHARFTSPERMREHRDHGYVQGTTQALEQLDALARSLR